MEGWEGGRKILLVFVKKHMQISSHVASSHLFFLECIGTHTQETNDRQASVKAQEAIDHLASFFVKKRKDVTTRNRTANLFLEIWVSLHHHPIV